MKIVPVIENIYLSKLLPFRRNITPRAIQYFILPYCNLGLIKTVGVKKFVKKIKVIELF